MPKWLVIQSMIMSNSISILTIMVMHPPLFITLFYYLRLISKTSIKWSPDKKINKVLIMEMIAINISLPVMVTFSL